MSFCACTQANDTELAPTRSWRFGFSDGHSVVALSIFDVRLAQYETGTRKPKADLTNALAQVLDVSPQALDVPDIDSYIGLMHTLFTLEDIYGLTVSEADGEVCLKVNKDKGREARYLSRNQS